MKDRSVEFPNRYRLKKVAGTDDIFDLVPAPGDVTEEGTYINKATLLKDTTAALYGKDETAVPDEIFAAINEKFGDLLATGMKAVAGTYVGSGDASVSLTFPSPVKFLLIYPANGPFWVSTPNPIQMVIAEGTIWCDDMPSCCTAYVASGGPSYSRMYLSCEKTDGGKMLTLTGANTTYSSAGIDNSGQTYNYFALCGGYDT